MPKYRVEGYEKIRWSVDVEAANEDEAEKLTANMNLLTICDDSDTPDREVESVEEIE
jgi:hypothetical protein